jgi:hypothetical protein
VTVAPPEVLSPTARRAFRRALPWIVLAAILLLVMVVLVVAGQTGRGSEDRLAADNPGPDGAQAVAEVLRQQGVDVTVATDLKAALGAVRDPDDTTVLLSDPRELLDSEQRVRLQGAAVDLVLVEPSFSTLQDLAPGVSLAGTTDDTLRADCDLPAVRAAGGVAGRRMLLYRAAGSADARSCLRSGDGAALVRLDVDGTRTTVLGAGDALSNGRITDAGDAALALRLLGRHGALVWYLPGPADLDAQAQPAQSLAELTPAWVTPLAVLLLLGLVAAAIWRGRRLGRIVVENLPVTVRARETMEGRARLYEKADARGHALDALRIGTVERLAGILGLPRAATVDDVIAATSAATGRDPAEVARILLSAVPAGDAELVALSDALLRLERACAPLEAVRKDPIR